MFMVHYMRKHYKFANIWWLLALLTFPLWLMNVEGWFRWAKTLSVLIPTAFVGLVRLANYDKKEGMWQVLRKDWVYWVLYGVLFLNIFEATLKDATLGNWFNAVSGFILCITIPFPPKYWAISKRKHGDLVAFTTPAWNFLYTSWNACFVYAENPGYFASSVCILLAAELYPIIMKRPELYIMARVYTLAWHILTRACYDIFTPVMDSSSWANENVLYFWGLLNVILHIPFAIWWFVKIYRGRGEEGPVERENRELAGA